MKIQPLSLRVICRWQHTIAFLSYHILWQNLSASGNVQVFCWTISLAYILVLFHWTWPCSTLLFREFWFLGLLTEQNLFASWEPHSCFLTRLCLQVVVTSPLLLRYTLTWHPLLTVFYAAGGSSLLHLSVSGLSLHRGRRSSSFTCSRVMIMSCLKREVVSLCLCLLTSRRYQNTCGK